MPKLWVPRLLSLLVLAVLFLAFNNSLAVFSLTATSSMGKGIKLSLLDTLVSPKGNFELGFVIQENTAFSSSSSSSSYVLAISYRNLSKNKTIVWEAPRPSSITTGMSKNSYLELSESGDLSLTDSDSNSSPWNTNTAGKGVDTVTLLDSGNLLLMAKNETIWQSFDNPTDTLLPTQTLNLSYAPLSSSSGEFVFDVIYTGIYLTYKEGSGTPAYWNSLPSNQQSNVTWVFFKEDGSFGFHSTNESSLDYHIPTDYGVGPLRRIRLDPDGNMRMYSWDSNTNLWVTVWQAVLLECEINNICGPYGICVYTPQPQCICPLGFSVDSATEGCAPNNNFNCSTATIVALERVDYRWGDLYPQSGGFAPLSASGCMKKCLGDCLCLGATYKLNTGQCWLKQSVGNGYQSFEQAVNLFFLKVSSLDPSIPELAVPADLFENDFSLAVHSLLFPADPLLDQIRNSAYEMATYVVSSLGTIELVLLILTLFFWREQRRRYLSIKAKLASLEEMSGCPSSFSFKELVVATNRFSECLGTGAFASVYKGVINKVGGCLEVAVKKLEYDAKGSEKQFRTEVMTIGKVRHVNLVQLHGFCSQPSRRLLVYEYMPNGSLDRFLIMAKQDQKAVLDWDSRVTIALGTARGIAYLHEGCQECILHCDIKPENILLDADFQPKVADFGLAKLIDKDRLAQIQRNSMTVSGVAATTIRGTPGYMAPEWLHNKPGHSINEKVDVYSFGIVLLDLVAGRKNRQFFAFAMDSQDWHMPTWARLKLDACQLLDLIDPSLQLVKEEDLTQIERFVEVALLCTDEDPLMRPSMTKVVQMLEGSLTVTNKSSGTPLEITRSDPELTGMQRIQHEFECGSEITSHRNPYLLHHPLLPYIGNSYSTGESSSITYASQLSEPR